MPGTAICPASPGTAPSGDLTATLVADVMPRDANGYYLFEGPVWIDGALYFSDMNPNQAGGWNSNLRKYVPGMGDAAVWIADAGTNGLAVDSMGVLFSATARKGEISKYDLATPTAMQVIGGFNSPNDITIADNGTIYFSDPQQGEIMPPGGHPPVIHIVKDGVDGVLNPDLQGPNGLTLSPANDILYVAVTGQGMVKKVTLKADGTADTVGDFLMQLQTPDGMTKDCLGNLYIAEHNAQQVSVYSPDAMKLATIKTGMANNQAANPTNVAFGGPDGKTLYITAAYSLWQLDLPVAGYPY
jgi:gluconolactonase